MFQEVYDMTMVILTLLTIVITQIISAEVWPHGHHRRRRTIKAAHYLEDMQ